MQSLKAVCVAGLTVLAVLGCGQRNETAQTTSETQTAPPVTTPPTETGAPAWVAQVRQCETELGQIVEQGRLNEVHDQALKLQATLKGIADQATPEQRQQLTDHLAAADRLADELHDAADAGDLTKTKAKYQEFKTHLRAIEGVFGVPAP